MKKSPGGIKIFRAQRKNPFRRNSRNDIMELATKTASRASYSSEVKIWQT